MLDEESPVVVVLACEPLQCDEAGENFGFELAYIVYDRAHDKVFNSAMHKYEIYQVSVLWG